MTEGSAINQEFGLIVLEQGKPQQALAKFLNLLLNYQYGLAIMVAPDLKKAASLLSENGKRIRCVCAIQSDTISSDITLKGLSLMEKIPLFLVLPTNKLGLQRMACRGVESVFFCAWERAFSQSEASLQHVVRQAFEQRGIGNLFTEVDTVPYPVLQKKVDRRLRSINTLPTLPEIVMRIMRLVNDPKTTPEELERVLCMDPAIVMKLLQVMRSPVFTGTGGRSAKWTLKEIITRLGVKKVGAIAQQVKMINSLVKPDESEFDLKRFWEHSVGCAIIADKLYTERRVQLKAEIEFNDYWIGSLLHDVGKLVIGFFFWDWFVRVETHRKEHGGSFRAAEHDLGDVASHERIGQLMLLNNDMGEDSVAAVAKHHDAPGAAELVSLVHVANNLSKDLGLGYLPGEDPDYDPDVLAAVGIDQSKLEALRDEFATEVVDEIKAMVDQCM